MGREGKVMRDWTRRLSRGMTQEERRELLESEIWVLGAKISHGPLHIIDAVVHESAKKCQMKDTTPLSLVLINELLSTELLASKS